MKTNLVKNVFYSSLYSILISGFDLGSHFSEWGLKTLNKIVITKDECENFQISWYYERHIEPIIEQFQF